MFTSKKQKTVSYIAFGIYAALLIWLIMFKLSVNIGDLGEMRSVNLIPFRYDTDVGVRLHAKEVLYNVAAFVPLGVGVSLFMPKWGLLKKALPGLCVSLIFETLQFAFAIGASDITDIIANTLGTIIGIGVFALLRKIFKRRYITVINAVGLTAETGLVLLMGILLAANM